MDCALLEMPTGVSFEAAGLCALDATASSETSVIKRNDENLLRQITEVMDRQLLAILSSRTAQEFEVARREVWEKYVRARRALCDTINLLIPKNVIELVRSAAEDRVASDLSQFRGVLFGEPIADQFEFTSWIVSRIRFYGLEIEKAGPPRDRDADIKLNADFGLYTMWGQMHYDCVLASMKFELPISEEIQRSICDGLRAWVNSSAIIEEALLLRGETVEQKNELFDGPWDNEDQELLDSSMRDLDAECASGN
jgi:hypothetical protein